MDELLQVDYSSRSTHQITVINARDILIMNMAKNNKKQKPVIWQDIVPVQRPKTNWQKFVYKIKKLKKKRQIKKSAQPLRQPVIVSTKQFHNTKIRPTKKRIILKPIQKKIAIICIICVIAGSLFAVYTIRNQKTETTIKTETSNDINKLVSGTPKYQTILPSGKDIKSLGGWTRVSPSNTDPVYAYVDKIGNNPINVSEQPLPEDFKTDTDQQIAQLAQNFKADEKITIGGTIVYIGTSSDGAQSVIFNKTNLLILIKSTTRIDNNSWTQYINSMK